MLESFFTMIFTSLMALIGYLVIEIVSGTIFYLVYNPIAPKWLYFIPDQLQTIGFFESIAFFICVGMIGRLIAVLVPSLITK